MDSYFTFGDISKWLKGKVFFAFYLNSTSELQYLIFSKVIKGMK